MPSTILRRSQVNSSQYGAGQFDQLLSSTETLPDGVTTGYLRSQAGFGHLGARQFGRAYPYEFPPIVPPRDSSPVIVLTSSSGAFLGTIRSDVGRPIIREIQFTRIRGSCVDCQITLNEPPSFGIVARSYVSVEVPGTNFGWYLGEILETPDLSNENQDSFVYKGIGLFQALDKLTADGRSFSALTDVGDAVWEIANEIVSAETRIGVLAQNINRETGVPFASTYAPDKSSIKKVLEDLATMTAHDVGVDGDGSLFFLPKNAGVVSTFTAGYNLHDIEIRTNEGAVRNRIIGTRTNPAGSGGTGWVIGAIGIDVASRRKYGTIEETIQVPGNMSDDDIQVLVDAHVALKKEPPTSATAKTYILRDGRDFIRRGSARIILPFRPYEIEYDYCNDPTVTFTSTDASLAVSEDTDNFVEGNAALKLTWTSANGERAETVKQIEGRIAELRFYVRPSVSGAFLRVGVGQGVWDDEVKDLPLPAAAIDQYVPIRWNLLPFDFRRLDRVAFQVISDDPGSVRIDKIEFTVLGHRHLTLGHQKEVYTIGPNESSIKMELGQIPARLEGYVGQLFAQAEAARAAGQVR